MISLNSEPLSPQIRPIRRQQVQQYLAISAFVATQLITGCSDSAETVTETTVPALFYETTEQCEVHAQKQQDRQTPVIKVSDCAPQMAAAWKEHDRHAPVYQSLSDCQADDVQCEATPMGAADAGYRPMFGGAYIYPYAYRQSYGATMGPYSSSSRFHAPRTVYRGFDAGSIVTPQGTVLGKENPGVVVVPQHTSLAAPPRPAGYTARGTITGRSDSTGFGSTFKSTGRGGK
jgi:uncharacterized protein YgiB involved in biofilm formation